MKKTIILTFSNLLILFLFFLLPKNNEWFNRRIIGYWNDFLKQKNQLDIEQRKIKRWDGDYTFSKQIADFIAKQDSFQNALILLPPSAYFKDKNIDYHVPEPAVFYYYTGLKTTWINSREVFKANWMVITDNKNVKVIPVNDKKAFMDSIEVFKKFPVDL